MEFKINVGRVRAIDLAASFKNGAKAWSAAQMMRKTKVTFFHKLQCVGYWFGIEK